ncbi:MAG: B12-binding domain-containing protein [Eubacterium ramulus]
MAAIAERKANEPVMVPAPDRRHRTEVQPGKGKDGTPVFKAVMKGNQKHILDDVKAALAEGKEPGTIINDELIPAINEVGALFEKRSTSCRS